MRVHKYQPKVIGWCQWRTERAQKMAFERGFWTTGSKIECLLCSGSGLSCSPFERQVWATCGLMQTSAFRQVYRETLRTLQVSVMWRLRAQRRRVRIAMSFHQWPKRGPRALERRPMPHECGLQSVGRTRRSCP